MSHTEFAELEIAPGADVNQPPACEAEDLALHDFNCHRVEVNWAELSRKTQYRVSEAFLERHCNRVDWAVVARLSGCQISDGFLERHCSRVDWEALSRKTEGEGN